MKYEDFEKVLDEQFKRYLGVSKLTFEKMVETVKTMQMKTKKKIGGPPRLCVEDQVIITLIYLREYRTQERIAMDFNVSRPTVGRCIKLIEDYLIKSGEFTLSEIKEEMTMIVDAVECPIERPQSKQKKYYSGKKTSYTESRNSY